MKGENKQASKPMNYTYNRREYYSLPSRKKLSWVIQALPHSMLVVVRGKNCGTTTPLSNGDGGHLGEELFTVRINLSSISCLLCTEGKDIPRYRSAPFYNS